ncbi:MULTISPECIES: hypothetical protein [Bacillus amyloliquefaciens group]|uniref:Cthe-2314-like HEPN domain-containing protein n=1 Tax=Bacillus velezensis TaxID=492670 RepID=A0ABC8D830_BACVE|nr:MULTISPECIES: hypothetical protein [Bacillus amyloliquefaciens group]APH35456.1 hypothetical protein BHE96_07675 [Bacillus subtilis]AEB63157.1 hypothetical protein LL3_01617 [Bacillus amyloliquefaciens LL3]AVI28293.1 hypothetical protein C3Z10_07895 [Bacillus velezensis]AWX71948.1 hypothetical protein BVDSYZ_07905 [Bacillus velezensis]MDK2558369.1 hypothetical protein [Bacillus amyloliquefaciens]
MVDLSRAALDLFLLRLNTLKNLYEFQVKHNIEVVKSAEKMIEEDAQNLSEKEKEEYYSFFFDDHHEYSSVHPILMREGIFLQAYFYFEAFLNSYCDMKTMSLNMKKSYRDIEDTHGIIRAMLYIKRYCKNKEPFVSKEWKQILTYKYLRNSLVHENGEIEKLKGERPKGLVLTEQQRYDKKTDKPKKSKYTFYFDETFINHMFDTYIGFIKHLNPKYNRLW